MIGKIRKNAFNAWLRKQVNRNDMVGDLAKDAIYDMKQSKEGISDNDETFPTSDNLQDYIDYLEGCGACDGVIESVKKAWDEFLLLYEK